jgi:hypothetical protein
MAEERGESFSLEKFMGVKLFAWLGGVALFFGVILFVKYAFENNLVPPAMRITLGFLTGSALVGGGLWIHRMPKYKVLAQAFCATGVLILYGVSYAAHAIYQFPAFGRISTLIMMAGITAGAFFMAVRLNALVVAVLGMVGGFLTPVLLATAQENTAALFGYIALLDIGLIALARHSNWRFLASAAAGGTVLTLMGWYAAHFEAGGYGEGNQILIPMGILLGFALLFLTGLWFSDRKDQTDPHAASGVLAVAGIGMAFAFLVVGHPSIPILYGFVLVLNLMAMAGMAARPGTGLIQMAFALATFIHLSLWSYQKLNETQLLPALGLYLLFGALHSIAPIWLARKLPEQLRQSSRMTGAWLAPVALLLMAWPILQLTPIPMMLWIGVLMVNVMVMGTLRITRNPLPMMVSVFITMAMAALWLFKYPASSTLVPFLWIVGGFGAMFSVAGSYLLNPRNASDDGNRAGVVLPSISASLPFLMLWLAMTRIPVANPTPVFAVALLMSLVLIALAIKGKQELCFPIALSGSLLVQGVWYSLNFDAAEPIVPLAWHVAFHGVFLLVPFLFRRYCEGKSLPWSCAALSGIGCFLLVYLETKQSFPDLPMGWIPAAFAIPSLLAFGVLLRTRSALPELDRSRLAWFGGAALLFITLIFPIQLDRQWLTVGWALEGVALVWLFRRVPHPGLQLTGLLLLLTAFARLALNQAVFMDYPRSGTPIFNWHLYVYGVVAAALFAGGKWFTDPTNHLHELRPRPVLYGCATVLLFLLLNIQIADYFTPAESRFIAFEFGGNFARDMSYSIAWGLFALALLGAGIWKRLQAVRYAAVGLLAVTLLKLFLYDLAAIGSIYRIGALMGVAVIAFVASFLYQRFFDGTKQG